MVQGRPLLEKKMMNGIDPRLDRFYYIQKEAECLMYAGSLCISPIRLSQNKYLQCLRKQKHMSIPWLSSVLFTRFIQCSNSSNKPAAICQKLKSLRS
ncbi:hypothetical protein Pint_21426 [Pistacia integerrima]|uniref:Uncharacterized protein n=1 Tax=Pistacia integerrima TaxID=434235 RepID=A0ACC0X8E7_9ROSI|nr:hypothetical protein Pint_21426 [Pistacia integerrima]